MWLHGCAKFDNKVFHRLRPIAYWHRPFIICSRDCAALVARYAISAMASNRFMVIPLLQIYCYKIRSCKKIKGARLKKTG